MKSKLKQKFMQIKMIGNEEIIFLTKDLVVYTEKLKEHLNQKDLVRLNITDHFTFSRNYLYF